MKNFITITIISILVLIGIYTVIKSDEKTAPSKPEPVQTNKLVKNSTPSQTAEQSPFAALISKAADGADVFIIEPKNGAMVSSPLTVKFGIRNMAVAKAGDQTDYTGHHHLLIDLEELPNLEAPLPATKQIIHFGGAQTETTIELESGEHELQLLLGNYLHIPHDTPVLSEKISITVE